MSQNPTSDDDPRLIDVLKRVIALHQEGDVQEFLALIDLPVADGMSSNNLLDNRSRTLIQLNCHIEAISIWRKLSQSGTKIYNAITV